ERGGEDAHSRSASQSVDRIYGGSTAGGVHAVPEIVRAGGSGMVAAREQKLSRLPGPRSATAGKAQTRRRELSSFGCAGCASSGCAGFTAPPQVTIWRS